MLVLKICSLVVYLKILVSKIVRNKGDLLNFYLIKLFYFIG